MKYTVRWSAVAEKRLAVLWMETDDRSEVTAAANHIDRELAVRPDEAGESRDQGRRILLVPPLGALYRVHPELQLVHVLTVWSFERKHE